MKLISPLKSYLEAVNKESLGTALKSYAQLGILRMRHHTQPKPWSELSLSTEFMPQLSNGILIPQGHLWNLADRIGQFRREGKNRRDNAAGTIEPCIVALLFI